MRDYVLGWELKRAGMDWKGWLLTRWGITGKRLLVVPSPTSTVVDVSACAATGETGKFVNIRRRCGSSAN